MSDSTKTAGAMVYLMEELGDARLRCDQLNRYVARAVKLVEQSSKKDHFFEAAGDLIEGIPGTLFKLHKALQAVALAANRIDYEEVKQELMPDKVEELESVLEDVRIRHVQRRSHLMKLEPSTVIARLQEITKTTREANTLPFEAVYSLVADLESGHKTAGGTAADAVSHLETLTAALASPPEGGALPSRVRLASSLRTILGLHYTAREGSVASSDVDTIRLTRQAVNLKAFAESMIYAIGQYKKDPQKFAPQLENFKQDLTKAGTALRVMSRALGVKAASNDDEKLSRFEEGKPADPTKDMSPEDAAEWKANTEKHKDNFKEVKLSRIAVDVTKREWQVSLQHDQIALREMRENLKKIQSGGTVPNLTEEGAKSVIELLEGTIPRKKRLISKLGFEVSKSDDEKLSRFEEGKPADPTKDMSPEDAAEWKANTEKHKDKFKAATVVDWKAKTAITDITKVPEDKKEWAKELRGHLDELKKVVEGLPVPFAQANISNLGGAHRASLMITIGLDEKWSNGILENSHYAKGRVDFEKGKWVLELFSGPASKVRKTSTPDKSKLIGKLKELPKKMEATRRKAASIEDWKTASVSEMEEGKWYSQSFQYDPTPSIYFYAQKQQKNKGWVGLMVDLSHSIKAKKDSVTPNNFRLWVEQPESKVPSEVAASVKSRTASIEDWKTA